MKFGFYSRLAADGIRKNKRMYFPYMLTCIGMVIMFYILKFLQTSESVRGIRGGDTVQYMLSFGVGVLAVFSCIFLFYTDSFLIRRRKKEFGLYNILGMGKKNIAILVCCETVIIFVISMVLGLSGGIVLSKLAELGILFVMKAETAFRFTVSVEGLCNTVCVFSVIFGLLLLNSLCQVWFSSTLSLLRSETTGEKPPKGNWFLGILGVLILAWAYWIAVNLEDPATALIWFFVAVLMVIVATYLIMVSGSVLLCRILQKNKRYYYKSNHFVSVSSMAYRMKRNGAGLASICILATMVLVMVSSTYALYAGMEDCVYSRYPGDLNLIVRFSEEQAMSEENIGALRSDVQKLAQEHDTRMENIKEYRVGVLAGVLLDGVVETDPRQASQMGFDSYSDTYQIFFVPLSDYNAIMGTSQTLEPGEVLLYCNRNKLSLDQISFNRGKTFRVKECLTECFSDGEMAMTIIPSIILVADDLSAETEGLVDLDGKSVCSYQWKVSFDTDLDAGQEKLLYHDIEEMLGQYQNNSNRKIFNADVESRSLEWANFLGMYGGLFYLGILLSVVFLFAAALIIYYKQMSEGYEDQSRFEIMQKVGMTKREIRKSINSQLLTVFFLPLLGAGLHICFAFPMIEKLLMMFNMQNRNLFILTTLGSFLVFAVFYVIIYRITSNAYYRIVSDGRK